METREVRESHNFESTNSKEAKQIHSTPIDGLPYFFPYETTTFLESNPIQSNPATAKRQKPKHEATTAAAATAATATVGCGPRVCAPVRPDRLRWSF